jgi:hypothetical protein
VEHFTKAEKEDLLEKHNVKTIADICSKLNLEYNVLLKLKGKSKDELLFMLEENYNKRYN